MSLPPRPIPAAERYACDFHGLHLRVRAEAALRAALVARLAAFPRVQGDRTPNLDFEFIPLTHPASEQVRRPTGAGRVVQELSPGRVEYFEGPQELYVDLAGRGRARVELGPRRVTVAYADAEPTGIWVASHPLFTMPLAELLKRAGLYMVHAGGLALGGRAMLIPGASGAGKTTLTLALLRGGFDFLADDTVFLSRAGEEATLRVRSFPDEVDVTEQTADFFPELPPFSAAAAPRSKRAICAPRLYHVAPVWEGEPVALVFPRITPITRSVLTPLPRNEALLQLLCNVVRTDAAASQAHLDALTVLVNRCHCFQLQTGQDFDTLPGLLRPLLDPNFPPVKS